MTGVLVKFVVSLAEASHSRPWPGPGGGIVDVDFVTDLVRSHAGEAFHQVQVLCRPHEISLRREVRGIHDESVAFPMAKRISRARANVSGKVRAPVDRNDAGFVHYFHIENHVAGNLHDFVVAVIAGAVAPSQPRHAGGYAAQGRVEILHAGGRAGPGCRCQGSR